MIKYLPHNDYFNWEIPHSVPSDHWQQVLTITPYDELVKFLTNNPAINHTIKQRMSDVSNGND